MFFQSCFLSDFIIDCLFLFRGLFFILLFFILYSAGVAFLFLLFLTFLGWVDLGGFMVFVF
ncbi:putative membrane protein [Helicobacter pylori Hp P-2b]|uniref:Putative membrane protein n=1 Tax=Helicobacter pylori Hp P-2 TaxID=992073 RepID=J0PL14_HELPX|nr:putative membrane protein [Helicobacter pylori Hp P-2]EJC57232.1 putative membrane protein [Helicobacter pylori Hp P-2b]